MAVAVLPYPNLDFVPLDILTAAELNQMVANENYLAQFANGLADGTNLSDGIILPQHMSAPAFTLVNDGNWKGYLDNRGKKHRYQIFSGVSASIPANSSAVIANLTLPSDMGVLKTDYGLESLAYGCDWGESFIKLSVGLNVLTMMNTYINARSSNYWAMIKFEEY